MIGSKTEVPNLVKLGLAFRKAFLRDMEQQIKGIRAFWHWGVVWQAQHRNSSDRVCVKRSAALSRRTGQLEGESKTIFIYSYTTFRHNTGSSLSYIRWSYIFSRSSVKGSATRLQGSRLSLAPPIAFLCMDCCGGQRKKKAGENHLTWGLDILHDLKYVMFSNHIHEC